MGKWEETAITNENQRRSRRQKSNERGNTTQKAEGKGKNIDDIYRQQH